jgi:hypothetical protein
MTQAKKIAVGAGIALIAIASIATAACLLCP